MGFPLSYEFISFSHLPIKPFIFSLLPPHPPPTHPFCLSLFPFSLWQSHNNISQLETDRDFYQHLLGNVWLFFQVCNVV